MWGNSLGWGISAFIVLLAVALVGFVEYVARSVTPPTPMGLDAANFVRVELPIKPESLLDGGDSRDAGGDYRKAIDLVRANSRVWNRLAQQGQRKAEDLTTLKPAIELVVAAGGAGRAEIFAADPGEIVNYKSPKEPLEILRQLGELALEQGLRIKAGKKLDEARKYYRSVFSLGEKLYKERLVLREMEIGLGLMGGGANAMMSLEKQAGRDDEAERWESFYKQYREHYDTRIKPMIRVITSIDDKVVGKHPGDLFKFAGDTMTERMWRVEAVLALGRLRYNAGEPGRSGDQRAAMRKLRYLADNEPDPVVKLAVEKARDLTIADYRMMGR